MLPAQVVTAVAAGALHLQGGMGDTVTVAQHPARAGKHGAVVRALVSDQVGRGHVHPRRQGPQVQVVDLLHPLDRVQVTGDVLRVHPLRGVLAQHRDHLPAQNHRPDDDEDRDERRDHDVPDRLAGEDDQHAGDHDTHRPGGVGDHLVVGALDVQAVLGPAAQQQHGDDVDHQAGEADREHGAGGHLRRVTQPADGLDHHVHPDREHRQHRQRRGEHLGPVGAIGASPRGVRPARDARRQQRRTQHHHIGSHVPGIRQQRQRPRHQPRDQLDQEEARRQGERPRQPPTVAATGMPGRRGMAVSRPHQPCPSWRACSRETSSSIRTCPSARR
ncbi:Uncharacterised protein [Streptococcus pneumoniae]|nr:Uncharacterised protein [Streptococcus pneumoniae]